MIGYKIGYKSLTLLCCQCIICTWLLFYYILGGIYSCGFNSLSEQQQQRPEVGYIMEYWLWGEEDEKTPTDGWRVDSTQWTELLYFWFPSFLCPRMVLFYCQSFYSPWLCATEKEGNFHSFAYFILQEPPMNFSVRIEGKSQEEERKPRWMDGMEWRDEELKRGVLLVLGRRYITLLWQLYANY